MATVNTETLKVRTTASTDAEVLGLVSGEDDLTVVDESTAGWVGVSTCLLYTSYSGLPDTAPVINTFDVLFGQYGLAIAPESAQISSAT